MVAQLRALALVAVLVAAGTVFLPGGGAGALDQGEITIREGEVIEKTYPIIAGNNPAGEATDPATCKISPYCDTIRLNIVPPADKDLGYFVRIQMSWTTRAEVDVPGQGEFTDNDMDMYVYKVPYDTTRNSDFNEEASGATGAQPETAYVSKPTLDIVVVNYLGLNTDGYTLKLTYVVDETFEPFELLEEEAGPTTQDEPTTFEAPEDLSDLIAEPAPVAQVPRGLGDVAVDDPFGLSGLAATTKAPEQAVSLLRDTDNAAATKPDPVSAGTALLWLAVVPGALLGSLVLFLTRRRKAGLPL